VPSGTRRCCSTASQAETCEQALQLALLLGAPAQRASTTQSAQPLRVAARLHTFKA